jgi:hypothetical protein
MQCAVPTSAGDADAAGRCPSMGGTSWHAQCQRFICMLPLHARAPLLHLQTCIAATAHRILARCRCTLPCRSVAHSIPCPRPEWAGPGQILQYQSLSLLPTAPTAPQSHCPHSA